MCGIFSILNNDDTFDTNFIKDQFKKGENRGPEYSKLEKYGIELILGFHRLAINGLNSKSNQPIIIDNIALICNGEIYNYKELYALADLEPETDSDCEVIIHLYKKYGIKQTLQLLDGVFAFVLCDQRITNDVAKTYIVRDPYGVRPLYLLKQVLCHPDYSKLQAYIQGQNRKKTIYFVASELKMLEGFQKKLEYSTIDHVKPGTYTKLTMKYTVSPRWEIVEENVRYHTTGFNRILNDTIFSPQYMFDVYKGIQFYLTSAVKKRALVTDRPMACLLSGGLDSSLIAALVNEVHKEIKSYPLETYSIGLKGSEDLKYARIVANYLGSNHTEIVVEEQDFVDAIPQVVYAIESYDTTTVRASVGNYLLGKYISENSKAKVIFNGDGSDELCGGYLYMHACPDEIEFDKECRRLLQDIHAFDVLRSDKSIASHGLEPRTPFLDRSWVQFYLSIPCQLRAHQKRGECEKFLLRNAFSFSNFKNSVGNALLPDEILWRRKEAFSDGVTEQKSKSISQLVSELGPTFYYDTEYYNEVPYLLPDTHEKRYYRMLFDEFYKGMEMVVPYFWMPKYVESTDASARTLDIYHA
jgi:asparagine synthase (glutamine-hydrolysing)